jgi:hypothetical protein
LQSLVRSAEYEIRFEDNLDAGLLRERVEALLSRESIIKVVERKNRKSSFDFRSLVYDLQVSDDGQLLAHVAVGDYGNVRPEDLVRELELDESYLSTHRRRLHLIE